MSGHRGADNLHTSSWRANNHQHQPITAGRRSSRTTTRLDVRIFMARGERGAAGGTHMWSGVRGGGGPGGDIR